MNGTAGTVCIWATALVVREVYIPLMYDTVPPVNSLWKQAQLANLFVDHNNLALFPGRKVGEVH